MDFALSEEQRLFETMLSGFLAEHLPLERLRALAEAGSGFDEPLWRGLCELGLQGLLVPERFGGSGLGVLDAAVAAEALGAAVAPCHSWAWRWPRWRLCRPARRCSRTHGCRASRTPRCCSAVGFAGLAVRPARPAQRWRRTA